MNKKALKQLTGAQKVDNLVAKFRKIHLNDNVTRDADAVGRLLYRGRELLNRLNTDPNTIQAEIKILSPKRLKEFIDMCESSSIEGSSDRKLVPIMHVFSR